VRGCERIKGNLHGDVSKAIIAQAIALQWGGPRRGGNRVGGSKGKDCPLAP